MGLGAGGEEQVAEWLSKRLVDDVIVLHDRRVPRSRANIDHIAILPRASGSSTRSGTADESRS